MSVGVDAHIDPTGRNRKIARIFGDLAQCPVGADDPVRPAERAAVFMKRCGEIVIANRADRGVRPYTKLFIFHYSSFIIH